jgi:hypothetical protein
VSTRWHHHQELVKTARRYDYRLAAAGEREGSPPRAGQVDSAPLRLSFGQASKGNVDRAGVGGGALRGVVELVTGEKTRRRQRPPDAE